MAQKTVVEFTDDLDDEPIGDGQGETVSFALRGQRYEIDLSVKNVAALEQALDSYIAAARKVPTGRYRGAVGPASRVTTGVDPRAVRAWAGARGITVNPRGKIKAEIVEQFRAAGY